jgi:IS30 family transposase
MKTYRHLSLQERERIAVWRGCGLSLREMASKLGRQPSSLCREINRNRAGNGYWPTPAHQSAQDRERNSHKRMRLKSQLLRAAVEEMLPKGWSPELIAGRLSREHPEWSRISHEAIYQWIYAERPDLIGYLLRAHPKRKKRWKTSARKMRIPERVSILQRPTSISRREEPGHWETDLVVGSGRSALQVLVERASRYSKVDKIPNKTAFESRHALQRLLRPLPARLRRSITYDNGPENIEHHLLNRDLSMRSWFCEPYHSWEKGQVENTNGLIRRFVPKRSNLDELSDDQIQKIETWLNDRPRKVLKFKTPNEVFRAWCCT